MHPSSIQGVTVSEASYQEDGKHQPENLSCLFLVVWLNLRP
jgi:hypothetical protein